MEIDKLLKKIEALKRNYEGLSHSSKSEKSDYIRLKRENEQFGLEVDKLRNENSELQISITTYKEELKDLIDVNKNMEDVIGNITHESKVKTEEIKKIKKHYEDKMKDISAKNVKLSEGYQSYRDNLAKKDDEINKLHDQINKLNSQVSMNKDLGGGLMNEIRTENDTLRNDIQILRQQMLKIQEEYEGRIRQVQTEKEKAVKDAVQEALKEADNKVDEKELESLKKLKEALEAKISEKEKNNEVLSKDIQGLVKDLQEAKALITDKNKSLSEKEDVILTLRKQIAEQKEAYEQYKREHNSKSTDSEAQMKNLNDEKSKLELKLVEIENIKNNNEQKLKDKQQEYEDLEKNMKNKLEYLHNDIGKIKKEANDQIQQLLRDLEVAKKKESELLMANGKIEELTKEKQDLLTEKADLEEEILDYKKLNKEVLGIFQKILKQYEPIKSNLSCLSCLDFLESPLMLICGHSICMKCFNAHSDPNSKDSIVFCEECKIETKNKELMESKVIETLCTRFKSSKKLLTEGVEITSKP